MATDAPPVDVNAADTAAVSRWRRWLLAPVAIILLLLAALPAGLWFLAETPPGRAFVARQIAGVPFDSGLQFEVARIDGSLLSAFTMVDVTVHDLDGLLMTIPEVQVNWEPLTLLGRRISINSIGIDEMRMLRMWRINPRDPDKPILPDLTIRVDRFQIGRFVLEEPVLGREEQLTAAGRMDIRDGRLLLDTEAGAASGDRLQLLLDAEPDGDRFDLSVDLRAPADGLVATATGVGQPMTLVASGAGSWTRWRGRVDAALSDARVALLNISADNGRFRATGELTPGALVPEGVQPLIQPGIAVDATASRANGLFDLRFVAATPALALTGGGQFDAQNNRFLGTRADLLVRQPQLIDPRLSGQGLLAAVMIDGALKAPDIRWTAGADQLRFAADGGPIGVVGLKANGRVSTDPLTIPFAATIAGSSGLPPEMQALLAQPRLSGTLSFANGTTTASDLRLVSAMANASGSAVLRANGSFGATFNASLPSYRIDGLGVASVAVNGSAQRPANGALSASGGFDVRTLRLENAQAAQFLGGPPRVSGQFALAPGGAIAISQANFTSPNLTFTRATARYEPATGRFMLDASGRSRQYGPVAIVASGTSTQPTATITLASPGFGVGLKDVVATIVPADGGIGWQVVGQSPQGPLAGNGLLLFGGGRPVVVDVAQASFAGIMAKGRMEQTAAGPFAGNFTVDGQGIDGQVRLAAYGAQQQVIVRAVARSARLPLDPPVLITNGTLDLSLLFTDAGPQASGSFDLAGVRRGDVVLTTATGRFSHNGSQTAGRITVAGQQSGSQPFRAVLAVQSIPQGYAATLDGNVGRMPLKLEQAAQIVRVEGGGWELKPVRLILPKGRVAVAGRWGDSRALRLVLDDVDLSSLNNLRAGLGISGIANGQVNIQWDAGYPVPLGAANLNIKGLRRSAIGGASVPVDVAVSARSSTADGIEVGASFSWQGNQLGRLLVKGVPGQGEDIWEQYRNAVLTGGIRYNGPVEPLWALVALEGQELRGPVAIAADISGTLANPVLVGRARGSGILYRNVLLGTEIDAITFDGRFRGARLELTSLSGRAGTGTIAGSGFIDLTPDASRIDIGLEMTRARLADSDIVSVTLSGPLRLAGESGRATLTGDLRVDDARIQIVQVETSEIPTLRVRREGEIRVPDPEPTLSAASLALDVRVQADDRIVVQGMGLDSRWRADMRVRGTAANPLLVGTATLDEGDFTFAGSRFDLTTGRVVFNGAPMQSSINIQAETQANDVTAFVTISGTAAQPDVRFTSSPSLPEDEILSRLLFGTSVAELSVTEALQLATAIAGLQSGVDTMGKIRRSVGLDRLRLVGENSLTGMGTGIAVGKRLNRNIYVEVITDSQGNTLATLQWSLSRTLSLLVEVASLGTNSVNLRYQRDY